MGLIIDKGAHARPIDRTQIAQHRLLAEKQYLFKLRRLRICERDVSPGEKLTRSLYVASEAIASARCDLRIVEMRRNEIRDCNPLYRVRVLIPLTRVAHFDQVLKLSLPVLNAVASDIDGCGRLQTIASGINKHLQRFVTGVYRPFSTIG